VRTAFEASGRTGTSWRIRAARRSQGVNAGRHRVRRMLRAQAQAVCLVASIRPHHDSRHTVAGIVLNRQFTPGAPRHARACGTTYDTGWRYLAGVPDWYSRKIVGRARACLPNWSAPPCNAPLRSAGTHRPRRARQPSTPTAIGPTRPERQQVSQGQLPG